MAWLESHQTLADHPKTRKLARILSIGKPTVIGHLHCFWWWALDYADDGDLSRFDALDIAIGAEWDGDPDTFVMAMVQAGFIDDGDALTIHDWEDYAGKLLNRKRANARRMKEARAAQNTAEIDSQPDTCDERASHVQDTQRARVEPPDQTRPDQTEKDTLSSPSGDGEGAFLRDVSHNAAKATQELDARFDEFWAHYPRKESKGAARKAWKKIRPSRSLTDRMIAAVEQQKKSPKWREDGGRFIPHPSTWLNNERWEDQPTDSAMAQPKRFIV